LFTLFRLNAQTPLHNKERNIKNKGKQVEFEQTVQTVSLALQTHFWLEYFYSVPYFYNLRIKSPVIFRSMQPTQTGNRTP